MATTEYSPGWARGLAKQVQPFISFFANRMSNSISFSSTVVASSEHASSNLAGEEVILDLSEGTYYGLNQVGTDVWELLSSPCRVEEICTKLEGKYEVEHEVLKHDILHLLEEMHEEGLIRIVSERTTSG
jgi:hypothetical protein